MSRAAHRGLGAEQAASLPCAQALLPPLPTGKAYQWEDPDPKLFNHSEDPGPMEPEPTSHLSLADVYKELRLRGYEYGPHFQGVLQASFRGRHAHSASVE